MPTQPTLQENAFSELGNSVSSVTCDLDVILLNPYRFFGVYANSPQKEILSNQGKMNAFLKVNREVTFPLDLLEFLPPVNRNVKGVELASAQIQLPADQLKHALFWFLHLTPIDQVAFNHLQSGDVNSAFVIWAKKDNLSSIQNRLVVSLIAGQYRNATNFAHLLYEQFGKEFCEVINETLSLNYEDLVRLFISVLSDDIESEITTLCQSEYAQWNVVAKSTLADPIIDKINDAISLVKQSKGNKEPLVRYEAGVKLKESTSSYLSTLRDMLGQADMKYQSVADALAQEILQCGIDYYNESNEYDSAEKALYLQGYALSIAEGSIAKGRCKKKL